MKLKISIIKHEDPPLLDNENYTFSEEGGNFGRHEDNTWTLVDENNYLSRCQGSIYFKENKFYLFDESSNGCYIKNLDCPILIGKGNSYELNNKDIILIGKYELQVHYINELVEGKVAFPSFTAHENNLCADEKDDSSVFPFPEKKHNIENDSDTDTKINIPVIKEPVIGENDVTIINITNKENLALDSNKNNELLKLIFKGAEVDLEESEIKSSTESALLIGRVLKESIQGTMDLLKSRTAVKNTMRTGDKTLINAVENNPLKFSPTSEHVIKQLISEMKNKDTSFIPLDVAMRESFSDLKSHQFVLAVLIQEVLLSTIKDYFSPENLKLKLEKSSPIGSKIPWQKKSRLWDVFEEIYDDIEKEATDTFQIILERKIADAYENNIQQIKK